MKRIKSRLRQPVSKKEKQEGGPGRRGVVFCSVCRAVYYKKHWRHNLRYFETAGKNGPPLEFQTCPACRMIGNRQYEGRVVVKNVPAKVGVELVALIKAFTRRAYLRDPLDRLIDVKKTGNEIEVLLTENQTAVKLAKKIREVFRKADVRISYSKAPGDAATATVIFE